MTRPRAATLAATLTLALAHAPAQAPAQPPAPDPFQPLAFLLGTWDANVQNDNALHLTGRYTFARELDGHLLARHATTDPGCKAPASFDCAHHDLLYVFADQPGTPLKADYFDSEGHVLHYDITTPTPTRAVFLSVPGPGPQFRLTYQLTGNVMTGTFQMHPPGPGEWQTYLEWSGPRQ